MTEVERLTVNKTVKAFLWLGAGEVERLGGRVAST